MTLNPDRKNVTVDTYANVLDHHPTYADIDHPRQWRYTYTGAPFDFVVPAGVTRILVEAWGGGSRVATADSNAWDGGAGGCYAASVLNVTPSSTIPGYVGAGASPGVSAQHSTFGGTLVVGAAGNGRLARPDLCVGDLIQPGGDGGTRSGASGTGGGGGGAGSTLGAGFSGKNGTTAVAGAGARGGLGTPLGGRGGSGGRRAIAGTPAVPSQEGEPGDPEIPPQTITKTYAAVWSWATGQFGTAWNLYQGDYGSGHKTYGKMGFDRVAIGNDIDSSYTINSVRLRLHCLHAYWSSGLNPGARIGAHNTGSRPGTTSSPSGSFDQWRFHNGWKTGETRWCTLPTAEGWALVNGHIWGFTTGRTGAGNTNDYGYFAASTASAATRPTLEISYTIPGSPGSPSAPGVTGVAATSGQTGQNGRDGTFPGGGAGGCGAGAGLVAGNGGHGFIRITEVA